MRRLLIIGLFFPLLMQAQDDSCSVKTKCFKDFFANGSSHGHFRNYFMTTEQYSSSNDHYANATGGAIAYRTAELLGFQLGVKGIFTFNTASSDLTINEGKIWERQLFDVNRPEEKLDLDRLEELFIKYQNKKVQLVIGRFDFDSPLLNPSDGRMKPYVYSGVGLGVELHKTFRINSRYINSLSPRSTTHFYGIGDNVGLFENGVNSEGENVDYSHQVKSDFIWVNSLYFKLKKGWGLAYHNNFLDGININQYVDLSIEGVKWNYGVQFLNQGRLLNPHNVIYYDNQVQSNVVSIQFERILNDCDLAINYSTVFGGRFLFPREFGREEFYGSISRLRIEGKNNVHVFGMRQALKLEKKKWKDLEFKVEEALMLVSEDQSDNKYQESDLAQVNVELDYHFHKHLKGLVMKLLLVNQVQMNESGNQRVEGMSQVNLITNINF